jgi:hypothetical protein
MYFKNTLSNSYKNFYTGTKRIKIISEIAGLLSKNLCLHIAPSSKNYEVFRIYYGVLFTSQQERRQKAKKKQFRNFLFCKNYSGQLYILLAWFFILFLQVAASCCFFTCLKIGSKLVPMMVSTQKSLFLKEKPVGFRLCSWYHPKYLRVLT